MARRRVLADTSLFIEYLRTRNKESTRLFRLEQIVDVDTCAIVAAEILYGARTAPKQEESRALVEAYSIHPFTYNMAIRVSDVVQELLKKNKIQDLRDIMIAATAIELG